MTTLVNGIALSWWDWMAAMLWQASLLIVLVSVVDLLIRRWAWPQVRHALWLLVLLKLVLPPTWSLPTGVVANLGPVARDGIVSALGLAPERRAPDRAEAAAAAPSQGRARETAAPGAAVASQPPAPRVSDPASEALVWQAWAFLAWLVGIAVFAALLAFRIATLRRWHREQRERRAIPPWFHELLVRTAQKVGLDRLPAIVFSKDAVAPAVYGVFRPVLLLPAGYTDSLSSEDAEHVLLHELAHIKRGDLWLHGIALLLQVVYWFNPLLLVVTRQLKHVRELCCDLTIANLLRERTVKYRQTLLETARALLTESLEPGMGLLGVFEEPFRLVSRLRWLERETWKTRIPARAASAAVAAFAILCVLPMSAGGAGSLPPAAASSTSTGVPGSGSGLFLREETWSTVRCFGIEAHSELRGFSKTWIGARRAATIEGGKTIVVDLDENVVRFVNHRNRSYVEAERPFDVARYLPGEFHGEHPYTRSTGDVEVSPRAVLYLGRKCREYDVRLWDAGGGRGRPRQDLTVWATTDVPGELAAFHELIRDRRVFQNRDEVALEELNEIRGIQLGVENVTGPIWWRVSMASQIVSLERQDPPADVYSIPPGYTKKDRFTPDDF